VKPIEPRRERAESIGIVGAGPAGLAAAEQLRRKGYQVTIYDRYDRVGGLLIYGIPNFKLEKEVVQRRERLLQESKVTFRLNCDVGRDISLMELRERHDAVLLATGVYKARAIAAPGVGLPGIAPALGYLTASNRAGLGDTVPEFDWMRKYSVVSAFVPWEKWASKRSWAFTDSGLLVKAMSWFSTPLSNELETIPIPMMRASQMPRVRQGWRLLALARDSGLSFISASRTGSRELDLRHMLTP